MKEAIQLAEGTKVEQDIKSELRNIEKKQKELEYSNHIVNSNKACIVESKQNNIKVPPLCTCCLKKTNDEEKLTYSWQTGNVQESISFHLPLCQDCSVHRREFHTKQMIMFVLVVIVAVITCVSLINFFAVNTAFLSLLIFSVMVITFQFFNKKLPLVLLDTSHATRDKSVQIIGVSTFRFLNPSYAQLFAKANNVAVQEKWIWKHSNEVHFPLLSRASFNVFSSFVVASLICLGIYNNIAEINKQKSNTTASNITSITSPVPVPITSPVTAPLLAKPVKDSKRTNKKIEKIVPTIDIKKDNAYKNKYDNTGNINKYNILGQTPLPNNSNVASKAELHRLEVEIEQYRISLQQQEQEVDKLSETINLYKNRLARLTEQINKLEANNKAGLSIDRNEYENMINEHNRYVELYNKLLYDYKSKYASYQQNLQQINTKINSYNNLLRR